jgi:hypothetical protein
MIGRLRRVNVYLRQNGVKATFHKIMGDTVHYARNTPQRLRYREFQRRLKGRNAQEVFVEIYERNLWESGESRSGVGSEAAATENIRSHLPLIFEKFNIRSMLDAPCGDFNWMRMVPIPSDMSYLGWDIVPQVIQSNSDKYANRQRRFAVANMLVDTYPRVDLMMCRDCLFHFSHRDICRTLESFIASEIPYLFTTTHSAQDSSTNTDIETGFFRRIDLFGEPFMFPSDALYRIEDFASNHLAREICLWDRSQVKLGLGNLRKFLASTDSPEST